MQYRCNDPTVFTDFGHVDGFILWRIKAAIPFAVPQVRERHRLSFALWPVIKSSSETTGQRFHSETSLSWCLLLR